MEGVKFYETFALMARSESIRLLLTISCVLKFKLYQMDVKITFLNGYLHEEIYVAQLKVFKDPHHPKYVYKLKKALYCQKQSPPPQPLPTLAMSNPAPSKSGLCSGRF